MPSCIKGLPLHSHGPNIRGPLTKYIYFMSGFLVQIFSDLIFFYRIMLLPKNRDELELQCKDFILTSVRVN